MSETKHTPGALRAADLIAALLRVPECDRDGQRAAVAQLIDNETAAPELLAAAKAFVSWADDCWGSWAINDEDTPIAKGDYGAAKSAINRVEGRHG